MAVGLVEECGCDGFYMKYVPSAAETCPSCEAKLTCGAVKPLPLTLYFAMPDPAFTEWSKLSKTNNSELGPARTSLFSKKQLKGLVDECLTDETYVVQKILKIAKRFEPLY